MKITPGSVAVITGGASGIGFGLAEALAEREVRLVLADVREDALEPAADALRAKGAEVATVRTDVTDRNSVEGLAHRTLELFGRVDLVCNNAGLICSGAPLWEQSTQTWDRMIAVKVMGVVHGVQAFAPIMIKQGAGHFLNTASSGGLAPLPNRTPYTATMHAVVGLTETLDLELKAEALALGATVLCPGLVDTAIGKNSATLGAIKLSSGAEGAMRSIAAASGGILTPLEVGEAAIAGIEEGRVHVAPGNDVSARAKARVQGLLRDLEKSGQVIETH
ncbi:NAD(P)-dependent dehydrogenase (short-subunit alcohol dehydrogenase family) [Pseudarthrobacter siccitolerans]|uniref:NAD(P)-dependent dehydrogenase (Short-subunit alcohol dehydrogenase family) n=1 Tax=Pseudarthrobacter siccitolerans TaxID=861266 RepID=A0ABU0PNL8_9MICC|nr:MULTISPECIES: SDR family NAD(P)-dependent oxidoreductase [Micrococcaceae]MDQ0675122.1 NAD(P)-dependent dehydrogenase (short-subunit alcohol dehydrogenase family) [Pseudarthrobacter siccitolerans]MDQ0733345.1 NAD(P)-dependent dehydrogenase (short-subunit alcohol dehydrogenase family) [Arthrobacter sp. B1I2]